MSSKTFRNVLVAATITPAIVIPVNTIAHADETINLQTNPTDDVVVPEEIVGSFVQEVPTYKDADLGSFSDINLLAEAIMESAKNFETKISFSYSGNLSTVKNDISKALKSALTKPGNDYVHGTISSWQYSYTSKGDFTMELKYHATLAQEQYVTEQVKAIAASLTKPGMSQLEKVLAVNEYVVTHTVYSKTASTTPHHVYAYLKEGKAVCQAYALLTYRLLTEMGMDARYVVGHAGEAHAWNSVEVDGQWYHLDTTWNDGKFNGFDILRNVGYKYFLVTSETLKKDHTWDEATYPVATDNRYSYFHQMNQAIEHNGEMYFRSTVDGMLYKMNPQTTNSEKILNTRVAYLEAHNEFIYFSDFSNSGYLTSYNLITGETNVIHNAAVTQLHILDGFLHYKVGSSPKKYELPLSAVEQEVRLVEMIILKLSEFSNESELTAARSAYENLTPEQKQAIVNLQKLEDLEHIFPVNLAAANTVADVVGNLTETSSRAELLNVITQYDTLFPAQQALVSNKDKVLTFKSIIATQDAEIAKVEKLIASLKATSKTYLADIAKVREAFDALDEDLQASVTNFANLQAIEEQVASAQKTVDLIAALDGKSIEAIMEARENYNNVPKTLQKYVTNLKQLTTFEASVKNVTAAITAINTIDPTSAKFVVQVTTARKALDKTGSQQDLVINRDAFLVIEKQAKVYDQIAKLKPTSPKYIAEVTAAQDAYKALGENNKLVTNIDKLTGAVDAIKPAQAVIEQITKLDGSSAEAILAARTAVNALDKTTQRYVTNLKDLATKEKEVKNVVLAINAIKAIDPASTKFVAQVTAARKAIDKASSQQDLITNIATFETVEKQAKVFDQIAKLKPTSPKYIAEVTAAQDAYKVLEENNKLVTNIDKLTEALDAIKPAQAVVSKIAALDGTQITPVLVAREAFNALTKVEQRYVTNVKDLTTHEKVLAAPLKTINLIKEATATNVTTSAFLSKALAMKKSYTALSDANKALITNVDDYKTTVALYEIKNAQKTRKWTEVEIDTFTTLKITGVTADNLAKVTAGFNTLKAGTGTATLEEIQANISKFIKE